MQSQVPDNTTVPLQLNQTIQEEKSNGSLIKLIIFTPFVVGSYGLLQFLAKLFCKEKGTFDSLNNPINTGTVAQSATSIIKYTPIHSTLHNAIEYQKVFREFIVLMKDIISKYPVNFDMEQAFKIYIDEVKQQMADKFIYHSAKISFFLMAINCFKLYLVSEEISKAKNLHEDAIKFQQVFNTTLLASHLRLKLNKSIQRLDVCTDTQLSDGICNLIMATGTIIQLYNNVSLASRSSCCVGSLVVLGLFLISIGNGIKYYEAKTRLKDLRNDLLQLENNVQNH